MKLHRIDDVKREVEAIRTNAWDMTDEEEAKRKLDLTLKVVRKIAAGSCTHPPTWCKELLKLWDGE